jgi:kynurenine formamidase
MKRTIVFVTLLMLAACDDPRDSGVFPLEEMEMVDLGALVTEDLPVRVWGKQLADFGFNRPNQFEDIAAFEPTYVVDSYYTLFNHGGPHVDAPNHTGSPENKGIDAFPLAAFVGDARVLDASHLPQGSAVPVELVKSAGFKPGEIAILYTGYIPPEPDGYPVYSVLEPAAARYLANVPVRAFATDALSVDSIRYYERRAAEGSTEYKELLPIHHAFLMSDILVFEQLENVGKLTNYENMFFVGVPLNIAKGNGMIVRPVVFVN